MFSTPKDFLRKMLKPLNDTSTISSITPEEHYKKLKLQSLDYSNNKFNVPSSVFSIYRFEKILGKIMLTFMATIVGVCTALLLINGLKPQLLSPSVNFSINAVYFFGAFFIFAALARIITIWINLNTMEKSLRSFGHNLERGIESYPRYFELLYQKLILRQVDHNWSSIFLLWFGSIFVAILYGLKDARWVVNSNVFSLDINWRLWIQQGFGDPDLVVYLFVAILIFWVVIHVVFALLRKKRRGDIEAFFSQESLANADTVLKWTKDRRKIWFRAFILTNIILILIPLSYLIVRIIKKRKQK